MREIGLYVHIPFCIKKCYYCDFLSYSKDSSIIDSYIDALIREIGMYENRLSGYRVKTIFIGGGTPSILETKALDVIVNELLRRFALAKNLEFTIESNPGTLTREKLKNYNAIGINRLSIGLQSFNNNILKKIGRIHSKEDFIENYFEARNEGFENINLDLIYGLPDQDLEDWQETLGQVIKLEPNHISAYSLKIEKGTVFEKLFDENRLNLPKDEEDRQMYHLAINLLNGNNIRQYEISNFAREGYECKHNLIYWNNQEYLGFGVSAHSYLDSCRYGNTDNINDYINFINHGKFPVVNREVKSKEEEIVETIFLGLRLSKGLDVRKFKDYFNVSIYEIYGNKINSLIKLGLLTGGEDYIKLTQYGMDVSNQVFIEFL
ncbi:MAG: radical SAM family heme chaperone HemW [Clostridia bacterium]|nr:radical SAM family heme chaperone HemW [Clostridia bacterium]